MPYNRGQEEKQTLRLSKKMELYLDIVRVKFKEQFIIHWNNQAITVPIEENKGFQGVSLKIKAPSQVSIDREEIARLQKSKGFTASEWAGKGGQGSGE